MDTSLRSRQFIIILVTVVTLTGTTFVGGAILNVEGETVSDVGDSAVTHQTDADQAGTLVGALPLENASTKFQGVGANDTAGLAVAGAGDVNGDGKKDVLVTAPANGSAGAENGAVYLFYGPVESGELNVTQANVTFVGSGGERAGADVALGDLNGDEFAEVVIGAPRNDTNGVNAGAAYVVDGQSEYDERVELADDENVTTLFGNNARDVAGKAVTVVDRGNESGLLAVAAPRDDGAALNAGAVSLIENATTVDQHNVSEAATATIQGQYTRERAGFSVADAGDFDTDNYSELIIGAPLANVTGENAGAAYVVDTDVTGTVSVATGVQFNGSGEGDRAGWAVSEAGDFNNDSVNDVLVGAPFNDSTAGNVSGAAYVLFGEESPEDRPLTDADVTLVGESRGDLAGWSVAAAGSGDISCDNVDDIIVGAPGNNSNGVNAGAAYLVYGASEPHPSLNLSDAGAKISGEGPGDEAGYAVAEANDSTGDGNEDILIGAPFNRSNGTEVGAAYLLDGDCPVKPEKVKTPTPTATPTPTPTKTPTPTP
ncbi:MAG: integrin alpha, partial [Haloarculaceae archaeon]